jgi:hypothetical protein
MVTTLVCLPALTSVRRGPGALKNAATRLIRVQNKRIRGENDWARGKATVSRTPMDSLGGLEWPVELQNAAPTRQYWLYLPRHHHDGVSTARVRPIDGGGYAVMSRYQKLAPATAHIPIA